MGSGSSGANTTVGSMSGSEPFSSSGTPVDTPPDTPGGESCPGETVTFGKSKGGQIGIGTDGLSARRDIRSRISAEALRDFKSHLSSSSRALFRLGDQDVNYDPSDEDVEEEYDGASTYQQWSPMKPHLKDRGAAQRTKVRFQFGEGTAKDEHGEGLATPLAMGSSLRRARRPPPLNLSSVSGQYPATHLHNGIAANKVDQDVDRSSFPQLSPYSSTHPSASILPSDLMGKPPHTAPLVPIAKSPIELPPLPYTAPLPSIPRAPLIQPSMPDLDRSPSPLTLPSPGLPWSLDPKSSHSFTSMMPLMIDDLTSPPPSTPLRTANFGPSLHRRRKVSLSKQMADLHIFSANSPVPPSLKKSPFFTSPASPFVLFDAGKTSPGPSSPVARLHHPKVSQIGTPFRVHMNPYFSQAVVPSRAEAQVPSP